MAFTRIRDDPVRLQKELQRRTFVGRYRINTPGNGIDMPYFEDPQLRIQKWGANTWTDSTNLESELRGLGKPLDHDYDRTYKEIYLFKGTQNQFGSSNVHVDESRATHPAWMYKTTEMDYWHFPFNNPQTHLDTQFEKDINTRIQIKDQYRNFK